MRTKIPPLILLCIALASTAMAQTFSIVGTGTTSNTSSGYPAPFGNFYYGARHQFFVTAAQLSAAGIPAGASIQSLGFNVTATNFAATHNSFQILVYTTTLTNPISTAWFTSPMPAASTTPVNHLPVVGWNQFSFTTPFIWNGTDNLIIETCFQNTSWTANASTQWTTTLSGATFSRWYRADAAGVCASTLSSGTSTTIRPNMRIGWVPATPCAGPITPGSTLSTANPVCSGASFTLSMSSPPTGVGLTYQWQSSPDGMTWSNISGATNATYTTNQTTATWYQCVVTCTADMSTGTSTPLQVTMASFLSCYCIPVYSTGSGFGDYINSVVLNGSGSNVINNVTGPNPSPYYTYYPPSPTTTTTLEQGCTYTLNVQVGTYAYNDVAAWIDFNQDGVLSASEKIGEVYNIPASAVASFTFTVPVSATLGVTRLRIREADQGTTSLDPCVTYTWGETEDYDVTIAAPTNVWYADNDGDGYGDPTNTTTACTPPPGYVADNTDCNDADAAVNPGAAEICNGMDDDCDGLVDDADPSVSGTSTWYADADGDGYGDASMSTMACVAPSGYVADNTDCNDGDAAINPGAAEVCNGIDDDCDGTADDGLTFTTYYVDADGDGYGDASDPGVSLCADPGAGYSTNNTDCNDGDPAVNPGAVDVCSNGVDDNCDGNVDENDVTVSLSPAGPITACHGTPVSLTATASGSGTMSYIWYRGLNVIPETSSSHTTTKKGTFWVVATNGLCSGVSNFVNISRIPSPPANITNLSGTNELCTSITLKANGTAYTYEWFKDGVSTGVTSKFYTVTATGNYTVKVTNSNGCTKESAVESIVPCPVRSTLVADASFSLYPNPTDGNQVFLSGRMGSDEPVTITVSTLLGQEVLRVVVNSEGGLLQTTLSLPADLASGTYVVKLVSGSSTITRNLVVQR